MGSNLAQRAQQSVANQQQNEAPSLQQQIKRMEQQFQLAMPRGAEAKQLVRDALTCIQMNPKLAEAEMNSVMGALMTCAQLGLRPGVGALGQAYLLPFWDRKNRIQKAQLIIGYQGYVELAHRSGRISSIHARTVYSNDYFELEYGAEQDTFVHRPALDGPRGEPRLFYAVARTVDGGYSVTDPMTVADMVAYRDKHATAKNREGQVFGPWVDHFEGMAHKTMVRKLMKLLPKSTEQHIAVAQDGGIRVDLTPEAAEQSPEFIDGTVVDDEDGFQPPQAPVGEQDAPPAEQPAPSGAPKKATKVQVAKVEAIAAEQKFDKAFLNDALENWTQREGATLANLTSDEADHIVEIFAAPAASTEQS